MKLFLVVTAVSTCLSLLFLFFGKNALSFLNVIIPDEIIYGRTDPLFCIIVILFYFFMFFQIITWTIIGVFFSLKNRED